MYQILIELNHTSFIDYNVHIKIKVSPRTHAATADY